jgi:hypothetical protein
MTWLALALAVERAGGQMEMIGARHSARLRGAIMDKIQQPSPYWAAGPTSVPWHRHAQRP